MEKNRIDIALRVAGASTWHFLATDTSGVGLSLALAGRTFPEGRPSGFILDDLLMAEIVRSAGSLGLEGLAELCPSAKDVVDARPITQSLGDLGRLVTSFGQDLASVCGKTIVIYGLREDGPNGLVLTEAGVFSPPPAA